MAEIVLSLADAHLVRTYPKDYKQPSFVSGYIGGKPLYTTVSFLPQEVVSRIEDEITLQERAEFNNKQVK